MEELLISRRLAVHVHHIVDIVDEQGVTLAHMLYVICDRIWENPPYGIFCEN